MTSALLVEGGFGRKDSLIGQSRARDLAVNVVLPFCHGLSEIDADGFQAGLCQAQYHRFGKLQENRLTREMADQLIEPGWLPPLGGSRVCCIFIP